MCSSKEESVAYQHGYEDTEGPYYIFLSYRWLVLRDLLVIPCLFIYATVAVAGIVLLFESDGINLQWCIGNLLVYGNMFWPIMMSNSSRRRLFEAKLRLSLTTAALEEAKMEWNRLLEDIEKEHGQRRKD